MIYSYLSIYFFFIDYSLFISNVPLGSIFLYAPFTILGHMIINEWIGDLSSAN